MRVGASVISRSYAHVLNLVFEYLIYLLKLSVIGFDFFLNMKLNNQNTTYKKFQCYTLDRGNDRTTLKRKKRMSSLDLNFMEISSCCVISV